MDPILHTVIALGCMGGCYCAGKYFAKAKAENVIGWMLDHLETEGFVATVMDKDGEKELILISELIAKALKETKKTT
jgi:hypothetical protein|tara:strand:+ start:222 stop:452 length:231 start_codon:yes stop_codon:yes gene_type:complete